MEINIPVTRSIFMIFGVLILLLCSRFYIKLVTAASSIGNEMRRTKSLKDSETLVSSNGMFKLGFFSPINSSDRYVGIWYNVNGSGSDSDHTHEVVWVANGNNPIKEDDTSGVLKISKDFNLEIFSEKQNKTFWSSNGSISEVPKNSTPFAELDDQGLLNLLSEDNVTSYPIWTSTPIGTSLLPKHTIFFNKYRKSHRDNLILWSWKSASDPSIGSFFLRLIPFPFPEFVTEYVYNNSNSNSNSNYRTYWRSGPWNGNQFNGVPSLTKEAGNGFRFMYDDKNEGLDFIFLTSNLSLLEHYVLNYDGNVLQKSWDYGTKKWLIAWQSMVSDCEYYGKCGSFGNCNAKKSPICSCLHGFEPKDKARWRKGDWSNGCVRKTPLRKCGDKKGKEDGFLRLKNRKVPDFAEFLVVKGNEDECRIKCLKNCSCLAYAYPKDVGCMLWSSRSLIDIQEFNFVGGADLFIRLAHSDLGENKNYKTIITVVIIITATSLLLVFAYCLWSRKRQRYGHKSSNNQYIVRKEDFKDLIFFKFKELEVATNYFSDTNKLGRGGFGPVYKGKLEDGQEIAVKRLCSPSGQGLHEFMNEVVLISKLQHKNLVRLLGCCVQGKEKLLVYEYMSNKSLDALLFDSSLQKELDWKKRFEIINGICRGLLYLHRDSRYKIIHRDLKASNILLDEELNPKISDFGTARIVETKQDQTNTKRVVGTYGYMSPEYAMEGRFSEKSDIFSLGVLLLEIVSGKRISSHLIFESLSLPAYAWKLWTEKNMISLVDETIIDPSFEGEMLKCIQLGLLCVQEFPEDRPTISALLYMLEVSDVMDLPHPTQPAFTHRTTCSAHNSQSINQITFTEFSGR